MDALKSLPILELDRCDRKTLLAYFDNSWELEEILMKSIVNDDSFYRNPDPLRNPIVFYLGHSPAFYINKLVQAELLPQQINPDYEILFEAGVDPDSPEHLEQAIDAIDWPQIKDIWHYRDSVRDVITQLIHTCNLERPIDPTHPLWALIMGMEHNRVHFETSSVLLRQFPTKHLKRPKDWQYAETNNKTLENKMIAVSGGVASLGKPHNDSTYGWDSEYGHRTVDVQPFMASQYLVTNADFLQFVQENGYENPEFWDEESWQWKTDYEVKHPRFWIPQSQSAKGTYRYRTLFDEIELPFDWPVEVNHYEAAAYCRWQGERTRLMTEAEWTLVAAECEDEQTLNLGLKFGSPSPVGSQAQASCGIYDLRGNVWEWLGDNFNPLPGFKPHPLYEDAAAPFFGDEHKMMMGGSWASNGSMAAKSYRNWFRPNFYQHAGFRTAQSL
ncbi:5-histidylcysteine sulfoxide synthase [Leptolyngbya cf. ectocarpi LEGE 11479]|uniref:5-histidylcysteine sulfoxide synthase n=1 Tax=Leptolyngbya cf. ectocarpi LEGE 11479 TaxID=1828722 RepID=A0A928ZTZ6_LEPEC|nr:5-histidylcysteine sulfoxide synthase [Leptolyngbya ectocarpi]MBE9067410.1 5-histidylcysteine sulfoxide synthase [Leptolyngbya cf. ectocarpi LEGE 11479]